MPTGPGAGSVSQTSPAISPPTLSVTKERSLVSYAASGATDGSGTVAIHWQVPVPLARKGDFVQVSCTPTPGDIPLFAAHVAQDGYVEVTVVEHSATLFHYNFTGVTLFVLVTHKAAIK